MRDSAITEAAEEVLFERTGRIGLITLNRPRALNAITLGMYALIGPQLAKWDADPDVAAIVIRGVGGKAFCAGGDVRALCETGRGIKGSDDLKYVFFRDEYRVIRQVHRLKTPYIALMDGITMGGGVGMSVNGRLRVATEHTVFAMPETAIGLLPDVGASRFLQLCPGAIGMYVSLTGARLKAADMIYTGLATHFVPSARLAEMTAALTEGGSVDAFVGDPGRAALAEQRDAIDRCFGQDSLDGIVAALQAEDSEWAQAILDSLPLYSPTSMGLTFRQQKNTHRLSIEEALSLEFGIVMQLMDLPDFFEGVQAVLIDRGRKPQWQPATIAELDDAALDHILAKARATTLDFGAVPASRQ